MRRILTLGVLSLRRVLLRVLLGVLLAVVGLSSSLGFPLAQLGVVGGSVPGVDQTRAGKEDGGDDERDPFSLSEQLARLSYSVKKGGNSPDESSEDGGSSDGAVVATSGTIVAAREVA